VKKFCHVDQSEERSDPAFNGTVTEFLEREKGALPEQLKNRVRLCPKCDKVNAYTLLYCNGCCQDLSAVEIGYTDNVFTGFIFGIKRTRFPLTISLRYQSEGLMVFDDLMQLTPCHLNCTYTAGYLPDLRCLFEKPKQGLALLEEMWEAAWRTMKKDFLSNKAWREKIIPGTLTLSDAAVREHVISGLNFPPSQYQLHLQFMLPPMMPFHYHMYLNDRHFTVNRFFPYEYVRDALRSLTKPIKGASSMDIETIIEKVNVTGVNYHKYFSRCYLRYGSSHRELAAWDPADFERVIVDGLRICRSSDMTPCEDQNLAGAKKADGLALQNYGRPFVNGRPSGTYYKFAKKPPLKNWLEMTSDL